MDFSAASAQPIQVFISYSHKDEALMHELRAHLSNSIRLGEISEWHDRRIAPGEDWEGRIHDRLDEARIILLLISADFLASDYCHDIEMKRALARHETKEAVVIPIILRPCDWRGALFEKLQALPETAKPVTKWDDRDEAFTKVAEGIRRIVRQAAARSAAGPGLGEEVHRLCDRDNQVDAFDNFRWDRRDARALVCGIRGAASELPGSLADRLTNVTLRDYARRRWSARDSVVMGKLISWPDGTDAVSRRQFLLSRIYRELDCEERDPSPAAFVRAVSTRLEKVIVLRHEIHAERWNREERALVEWYLRFWDKVNALGPAPQFVVFLNLIYPEPPGGILQALLHRARFNRPEFDRQLQTLFAGASRLLLEELACIQERHVREWFARHGIFDESDRLNRCAELFKGRRPLPMKEIEQALKRFLNDFLR